MRRFLWVCILLISGAFSAVAEEDPENGFDQLLNERDLEKKIAGLTALAATDTVRPELRVKAALAAAREIFYVRRWANGEFQSAATREDSGEIIRLMESLRTLTVDPDPQIYLWLARCHARIENLDIARNNLDKILKMTPEAQKKHAGTTVEAYLLRGDLCASGKQYCDAFQAYGLAAAAAEGHLDLDNWKRLALFRQAKCAVAGGQREIALEIFRKIRSGSIRPVDQDYADACIRHLSDGKK